MGRFVRTLVFDIKSPNRKLLYNGIWQIHRLHLRAPRAKAAADSASSSGTLHVEPSNATAAPASSAASMMFATPAQVTER